MRRWGSIVFVACVVVLACAPMAAFAGGYRATQVWGEAGDGRGELRVPKGVATWRDGSVWVVDYDHQTLLKYAATGELLGVWGGLGSGPGKFDRPSRVAVGPDGTVYVTDAGNQRIQCFSQSGQFLGQWGRAGSAPGEFAHPRGIDVAADGAVYVTDQDNHRVQVFTARGRFLLQWGGKGRGRGRFAMPKDVAVSGRGVYVVDARADLVQIFNSRGRWLGSFGGRGSARGRLAGPRGLCVDARGHVFVADTMNHRIQEFTGDGAFVREWGCEGSLVGMFKAPRDVTQAPDGSMIVVDTYNRRLQRFAKDDSADDAAPVTSCNGRTGWRATPLELAFTAVDRASGVAATYASVDGANFRPLVGPVTLGVQGLHVLRYFSVDEAGNQEAIRRRAFRLDWGAPTVRTRTRLRAVAGARVAADCTVADARSPACLVWARLDRGGERVWLRRLGRVRVSAAGRPALLRFSAPGSAGRYDLTVSASDLAGNVGRAHLRLIVRPR